MRNRKFVPALTGLALTGLLALSACGSGASSGGNVQNNEQLASKTTDINPQDPANLTDGHFVWPLDDYLPNWNGNEVDGNDENDVPVYSAMLPRLFLVQPDGTSKVNPDYLTSATVTSTSPQVITYEFNPKAHWTDGKPLSWQDLKAQWQAMNGADPAFQTASTSGYADIASVTQGKSATEAVVTFSQPYAEWQGLFAHFSPLYPQSVNATPDSFNSSLANGPTEASAGPFKLGSFDKNNGTITLVRNPDWWGAKPVLSQIIFQVVSRDNRADALQNNEISLAPLGASADLYRRAQAMSNVTIHTAVAANFNDVWFDGKTGKLLSDQKLRVAVAKGINSVSFTKAAVGSYITNPVPIGNHIYTPGSKYHEDHSSILAYDPAEAGKEMDADGWTLAPGAKYRTKNGAELDLSILDNSDASDSLDKEQNTLLINQLAAIGIKATVNLVPSAQFATLEDKFNWDLQMNGWLVSPFPISRTAGHYTLNGDNPSNYEQIGNATINNLYAQANGTLDDTARAKLGNEIDTQLWQEAIDVPLFQSPGVVITNKYLANMGAFGFSDADYTRIGFVKH
ncbi:MAG TPA: ABC transporter family substrate-binding protein [Pseudonocardiaceae bacterium]|nr:ABC transporter family substrate-binding protein [Pseudonocardiaceae bacterium]